MVSRVRGGPDRAEACEALDGERERLTPLAEGEADEGASGIRVGVEGAGGDGGDADRRGEVAAEGNIVEEPEACVIGDDEVRAVGMKTRKPSEPRASARKSRASR